MSIGRAAVELWAFVFIVFRGFQLVQQKLLFLLLPDSTCLAQRGKVPVNDLKPRVGLGDRFVPGCEKLKHAKEN